MIFDIYVMSNPIEEVKMIHALISCGYGFGSYYGLHFEQRKMAFRGSHNWKVNNSGTSAAIHTTHFKRKQGHYQSRGSAISHLFTALVPAILGSGLDAAIASPLDQFVAFKLSILLSLGEKWLILSPLVVILIIWQMSRSSGDTQEEQEGGLVSLELTEEAKAKRQRVVKELERIKLKTCLLNEVHSLGKVALQTSVEQESRKRQVDEIIERLQEISKRNNGVDFNDSISLIKSMPELDGDWCLIYVSRIKPQIGDRELFQLSLMELLGMGVRMGLGNKQQKLSRNKNQPEGRDNKMLAQNTAEMRLDILGRMEIALQGSWENLRDGRSTLISFDTVSLRPVELFGRHIREDIPSFSFPVPSFLQTITEWELIYLDDNIRINKAKTGALLVFRKV